MNDILRNMLLAGALILLSFIAGIFTGYDIGYNTDKPVGYKHQAIPNSPTQMFYKPAYTKA